MWIEQYQRMLRSRDRLKSNQKVVTGYAIGYSKLSDEFTDDVYSCIQNIYHFKDWLIGSKVATKEQMNQFLEQNSQLKVCQDICNGSKHLTTLFKDKMEVKSSPSLIPRFNKGGDVEFLLMHQIVIDGTSYNSGELIDTCIFIWENYLKSKSLL